MDNRLKQRIDTISAQAQLSEGQEPFLFVMEELLKETLEKNPQDTEAWIYRIMVEFNPPWLVFEIIFEYLEKIFEYDPYHIQATLIMAFSQDLFFQKISDETFDRLCHIQSEDKQILGMVEIAKAWYFENSDPISYEKHLKKSIEYAPDFVANYVMLGKLYFTQGDRIKGKELIKKGLTNVTGIYSETYNSRDITDIEEFFCERYKDTHITRPNLEDIKKWLTQENPSDIIMVFTGPSNPDENE